MGTVPQQTQLETIRNIDFPTAAGFRVLCVDGSRAMTRAANAPPTVFVIDDLIAKPGCGEALHRAYLERYAPGAQRRGMTLVHQLVSPPYWLPDGSNRLLFVWTVPGPGGAWAMKHAGRQDPELAAWWTEEVPRLVAARTRAICAEPADLAELARV